MSAEVLLEIKHGTSEPLGTPDDVTERILAAALTELQSFGFRRTSMEDVARRAGISRVTVYRRFASKRALIEAVILKELQTFLAELDRVLAAHPGAAARMVEGFVAGVAYVRRDPLLGRVLETEPEQILPYLTSEASGPLQVIAAHVSARLRETPEGARLTPARRAHVVEALLRISHSVALCPRGAIDLEDPAELRRFGEATVRSLLAT